MRLPSILLITAPLLQCGDPLAPPIDDAALEVIAGHVDQWVRNGDAVGAELLMVQNGEVILHHVAGWKDREANLLMEENTVFSIASMTKPLLATAMLMLIDEGAFSPSDFVAKFLPSFDNDRSRHITIRHLMTRTAGFTQPAYPRTLDTYATLREAVDDAATVGPADIPGTIFARTQAGSGAMGALVAEVSGIPLEGFFRTRIITRLGMEINSTTSLALDHPLRPRVASQYLKNEAGSFDKVWDGGEVWPFSFFVGSSGLFTTVTEYAKFLDMWLKRGIAPSGRLLSEQVIDLALEIEPLSIGSFVPYGMHLEVDLDPAAPAPTRSPLPRSFGHRGSTGTIGWVVPKENLIVVYFTQSARGTTHHEIPSIVRAAVGR